MPAYRWTATLPANLQHSAPETLLNTASKLTIGSCWLVLYSPSEMIEMAGLMMSNRPVSVAAASKTRASLWTTCCYRVECYLLNTVHRLASSTILLQHSLLVLTRWAYSVDQRVWLSDSFAIRMARILAWPCVQGSKEKRPILDCDHFFYSFYHSDKDWQTVCTAAQTSACARGPCLLVIQSRQRLFFLQNYKITVQCVSFDRNARDDWWLAKTKTETASSMYRWDEFSILMSRLAKIKLAEA